MTTAREPSHCLSTAAEPVFGRAVLVGHAQVEEHGQDLGVGGDGGRDVRALGQHGLLHQGPVVVHVAVQDEHGLFQARGHVALHQPVHGVAVGHGNDAVAGPAGVGDDVQGFESLGHLPEQPVFRRCPRAGRQAVVAELAHQLGHLVQEPAGRAPVVELAHQHLAGVRVGDGAAVRELRLLVRGQAQLRVPVLGQDEGHGDACGVAAAHFELVDGFEDLLGAPGQEVAVRPATSSASPGSMMARGAVHVLQDLALNLPEVVVQLFAQRLQGVGARALFQLDRGRIAQLAQGVPDGGEARLRLGVGHQLHVQAEGHEVVKMSGQLVQGGGGLHDVAVKGGGKGGFQGGEPRRVGGFRPLPVAQETCDATHGMGSPGGFSFGFSRPGRVLHFRACIPVSRLGFTLHAMPGKPGTVHCSRAARPFRNGWTYIIIWTSAE